MSDHPVTDLLAEQTEAARQDALERERGLEQMRAQLFARPDTQRTAPTAAPTKTTNSPESDQLRGFTRRLFTSR